jgi:hypothetical protein
MPENKFGFWAAHHIKDSIPSERSKLGFGLMKESEVPFRFVFKEFEPVFEHGFILCDPERLDQFCHGESQGHDLLARFDATGEWQGACQHGVMVCVFNVEPHEYTLVVRYADSETYLKNAPHVSSRGWLLGTEKGTLVLANLNNLMFWDPWDTYEYDNNYNKYKEVQGTYHCTRVVSG